MAGMLTSALCIEAREYHKVDFVPQEPRLQGQKVFVLP